MPFFSASDLRVSSAAKELVMPAPIRAAQSAMPEKGNLVLIITPFISLIQAPTYKIIKKWARRCKLTETKSSTFLTKIGQIAHYPQIALHPQDF